MLNISLRKCDCILVGISGIQVRGKTEQGVGIQQLEYWEYKYEVRLNKM
jgi:hypothetical protein